MSTIRYGSTASKHLVWGQPQPIQETSFVPIPPPPLIKVPVVTVHDFDGLIMPNGWDMTWDDGNGNLTHLSVTNGGITVAITNAAGTGKTGKYRRVI